MIPLIFGQTVNLIKRPRVELLDSFRFLAILMVMLYHFTWRWAHPGPSNLCPYGDFYGKTFYYGYLGVHLFFIISGFVISFTLSDTRNAGAFFKNRFIRLFPPMLLCTILTGLIALGLDGDNHFPNAHRLSSFLPSLTFTHPGIWTTLTQHPFAWTSLSYWSLWVEVQFYFIAGSLYFLNRRNFVRNFLAVAVMLALIAGMPIPFRWIALFDVIRYIGWFAMGIVFEQLYTGQKIRLLSVAGIAALFLFCNQFYVAASLPVILIYLVMLALFGCMIYRKTWLSFLDNRFFRRIGLISYSGYLLHEVAGVLLINKYAAYLGRWSFLSPFIVMTLVIVSAELSYRYYEQFATRLLKKWMFR